jgi:cellulose synthase operon protein C
MKFLARGWLLPLLGALWIGWTAGAAADEKSEAATRQYVAAVALQNRGVFDLAADEWSKFLKTYPDEARADRATHYLGVCYLQTGRLDDAVQCFQTVIKKYPKFALLEATYLHLGVAQFKMAQGGKPALYDAAAATFDTLVKNYPDGKYVAQALFNRGDCFYHRGHKQQAAELYAQMLAKYPDDKLAPDALYALGVTQEELGRTTEAGASYDKFLEKYPNNSLAAEVVMRRGETLFAAGQFDAAAQWFASAASRDGFTLADHATVRQAAALAAGKKFAEAAAVYAGMPKQFPKSRYVSAATLSAGKCYYLSGDYKAARLWLEKVLGGEGAQEAAHWTARSLLKEGKPSEALPILDKVLPTAASGPFAAQLAMDRADALYDIPAERKAAADAYANVALKFPQDALAAQALYMAGFTALGQSDYATALKHAEAFLAVHAASELTPDVMQVAAEANLQLTKYDEAEKLFTQLLGKYPKHGETDTWRVRRGLALQMAKQYQPAVEWLQAQLPSIHNPDAIAEAQFIIGGCLVEQKQFAEAITALDASLAAAAKWRQADETMLLLAHAYHRSGKDDKAKETLQKLLTDLPESKNLDRAHYRLGEYSAAGNDVKAAAAEYRTVTEKWTQSALASHAWYGLGWALLGDNQFADAERAIDALVSKYPGDKLVPRGRYARGMARHQLGKFAPAIEDIQAFLTAEPQAAERSDARYVLGLCQVGLKQYPAAIATLENLLQDDPHYVSADKVIYELAWAAKAQKKDDDAAAAFARLAKECPQSPLCGESLFHVGEAAYKKGDFAAAAVAYHAALQKAGRTELGEKATHKLAWAYFRLDKPADAKLTFAYQRSNWPQGPLAADAAFMEAECLFKQKKFTEALADYEKLGPPSSRDFQVLLLLHGGQAAGQLKQWDKALELLTRAAKDAANSPYLQEVLYEQGFAQQNLEKLDDALASYGQAVAKGNTETAARAQFMIGEIQFQQKKHADAVKSFFVVIYTYAYPQWQADATYEAARCFEVLGKKPQAVKQYQELIDKFPQSDKVPLAKERVRSLQEN